MSSQSNCGDNTFVNVYHQAVQTPVLTSNVSFPSQMPIIMPPPQSFALMQGPQGMMLVPIASQGIQIQQSAQNDQIESLTRQVAALQAQLTEQTRKAEAQRHAVLSAFAPAGLAPLRIGTVPAPIPATPQVLNKDLPPAFGSEEQKRAPLIKTGASYADAANKPPVLQTNEDGLLQTSRVSTPTPRVSTPTPRVLSTEEQQDMKCYLCPGSPIHTLGKCFNNHRCDKCNQFGHGQDFCKTPKEKYWVIDPEHETKIENRWWTEVAEAPIKLIYKHHKSEEKHEIKIKTGYALPHKALCCAFRDCKNATCKRPYHIK